MFRAAGEHARALEQAKLAETLARENGSHYRLQWIRDEFALPAEGTSQERALTTSIVQPDVRSNGGPQASRAPESKPARLRALASRADG
jgi:hypothetical protein